ncbi:GGDEF domain-containing protein [Thalassotalea profundi]|uniref:diguanylate cyclase n=2 Tax=Thalassotalea profundi TaxID=2036687 RepID=A0ABQ3IVK4_9GAMM|nr:GGDEF domain-containing protein [Thalassotalea profundi]
MRKNLKTTTSNNRMIHHTNVIALFALVGMSITASMGILGLFNENYFLAAALFLASIIYFLGYFSLKKFNNTNLSSAIVLYSLYLLMFYLVFTGGVENTGPLWIYIVPPVSLYIHGFKRGLTDIALFIIIIGMFMFMPINVTTYSIEFKLRLIYSFLTVTFLSALYEYSRTQSFKRILELSNKYEQLANYDPLTQLSNRRDALHILQREQARILRNKEALSIILCDVDYFKKVNDQLGHNAGDAVLVELASLFTRSIREQDCVARWGGEEFLFILPQTSAQNAFVFAEKIKKQVQNHLIRYENNDINITVSMGVVQLHSDISIDEAINNADKHLYQAKNSGRNEVYPKP